MVTRLLSLVRAALCAALLAPGTAWAQASAASPPPTDAAERSTRQFPVLHHAPISVAPANRPLVFEADIDAPELVRRAQVAYRTDADATFRAVELLRSIGTFAYKAEIPAAWVRVPSLSYTIEFELVDGRRIAVFASREQPHRVAITDDYLDLWERALYTRLEGRRSVATILGEYVSFGSTEVLPVGAISPESASDYYYRLEGGFTYRPLRVVTEFNVRLGVLRGKAPTSVGETAVGINYTASTVRFHLADAFHADVEGLAGITEVGFELGGGGQLLIGDPYGSKLALGVETIHEFGTRVWSRVDISATPSLTVAPIIEVTNLPHADAFGVRLLLELAAELGGGFGIAANGGYQARQASSGGPGGALRLSYAF